jgi:hypothetical protein
LNDVIKDENFEINERIFHLSECRMRRHSIEMTRSR